MLESGSPIRRTSRQTDSSAWAPFREPLFRSLWTASVISYTGSWMQNLGTGWMMTSLTTSPLMISMVQVAMSLPVFLVALPAGALADMMDRRRLLLITQICMAVAAATLGVLTILGAVTPWVLLLFTFAMGLTAIMNDPAWQAITPEIISAERHASAVTLNSAGYNVARAAGPALGGWIIAAAGSGIAFLMNAASFLGVIFFLYRWKRPAYKDGASESVGQAIRSGMQYMRGSSAVKSVLVRTVAFSFSAAALLALLPLIARPYGAVGYGLLLGLFGAGAIAGAILMPRVRQKTSVDGLVSGATLIFAAVTFGSGQADRFSSLCAIVFVAGVAWIGILACLNIAAQTMTPPWVRARALSVYLLALQGGMAAGSALWGELASSFGLPVAMSCAGLGLLAGLLTRPKFPLLSCHITFDHAVAGEQIGPPRN